MLQALARVFEFKETSISKKTLRRILILMLLSIPAFPLSLLNLYDLYPNQSLEKIGSFAIVVGVISMFCFLSTRFVNRFYFPDKYLDEWEIAIKHKSMAFAFMVMFWAAPLVILALLGLSNFQFDASGEIVFFCGMSILLALCYIQIFHALWQVRPIDAE